MLLRNIIIIMMMIKTLMKVVLGNMTLSWMQITYLVEKNTMKPNSRKVSLLIISIYIFFIISILLDKNQIFFLYIHFTNKKSQIKEKRQLKKRRSLRRTLMI